MVEKERTISMDKAIDGMGTRKQMAARDHDFLLSANTRRAVKASRHLDERVPNLSWSKVGTSSYQSQNLTQGVDRWK